jgi:hypothetical protein
MAVPPASVPRWRRNQQLDVAETKRSVGPVLNAVMEPGEQILAGSLAVTGWWRWREACIGLGLSCPALLAGPLPVLGHASPLGSLLLGTLLPILLLPLFVLDVTRRNVFVAVTDRQLICLSMRNMTPSRVRFHVPIGSFQIRKVMSRNRYRSLAYAGPGVRTPRLRVTATGRWRQDMDEVTETLQAAGVPVDGFVPAPLTGLWSAAEPRTRAEGDEPW